MAMQGVRWRNVREFLDDLPRNHCHVKPPHEFCTVCMRINYIIAHDCPLFHHKPKRKLKPLRAVEREEHHEPIKDHLTAADVKQALKGEEFPIIEFAGPRGSSAEPEEEVLEVVPIEVVPIEEEAPKPKKPSKPKAEEAEDEGAEKPAPKATIDPDELMHRIMEEIDFPEDEEEADEEAEAEVAPEEEDADKEPEQEADEGSPKEPPRVEKKAVTKRRPKGGK